MDKIIKSSPSSRIFVSVSTLAIVTLLTYSWIVAPQINYLQAAQQHKIISDNAEKKVISIKNQLQKRNAKLAELNQDLNEIRDNLFTYQEAKEFFSDFDRIALESGCNINALTFTPARSVVPDSQSEHIFSVILKSAEVVFTGKYETILKFHETLGGYRQRISIGNLLIKPNPNNTEEQDLLCSMTITIYLIENKEAISNE
ncbi:MAG: type 4a pilus biogenesis protein PilO [Planctomycetota bacterium]